MRCKKTFAYVNRKIKYSQVARLKSWNTKASVSKSDLWSVENLIVSVFFGPFFIVMMNSLFCGPFTFGTMLMNSPYGHCNKIGTSNNGIKTNN